MTKDEVRRLSNKICNFVLIHGEFWKTDLKLKDKLKVYDEMNKNLLIFLNSILLEDKPLFQSYEDLILSSDEDREKMSDKSKNFLIAFSLTYGNSWNFIDFSGVVDELKFNYNYDASYLLDVEEVVNSEYNFKMIKGLVHAIYRNNIIEDIHERSSILTDSVMKKCNIDFMNRFGYVYYELIVSKDLITDFLFILDAYESQTLLNPLNTKTLLKRFGV